MNNPDFTFAPNDPREPAEPPIAEPVHDETPPPPPPPPARRGTPLLTLLLFLVLAGGLYVVWADPPQLAKYTAGGAVERLGAKVTALSAQDDQVASQSQALAQQVQALSDRVDKLEKNAAPAAAPQQSAPSPDVGDLQKQVADLSAKVDALAARPAAAPQPGAPAPDNGATQQALADLAQKVDQATAAQSAQLADLAAKQKSDADALRTRLDQLEKGAGQVEGVATRANVMTRVQAAEVALLAGQKLGNIPGAPPALARFANKAPPTDAQLREAFPEVADHARGVSQPDLASKSLLERSWLRLQESVTVRQGDDVLVGDPAAGILADAQAKVNSDDLQGAVAALQKLRGPAADAVAPWVEQVNAVLAARAALASMAAHS
jgi:hypothetical protein